MGKGILILGESGSGKSMSLKNINWDNSFLIKTIDKPLPYKNNLQLHNPKLDRRGNYLVIRDINKLLNVIKSIEEKSPEITKLIIDDFQYYLSRPFVEGMSKLPKGTKVYDMMTTIQTDIGIFFFELIEYIQNSKLNIYILSHSDYNLDGSIKMKTLGKLLEEKMSIEGLFTIILYAKKTVQDEGIVKYEFITNAEAGVIKSPEGMFENSIENDLEKVDNTINQYYTIV